MLRFLAKTSLPPAVLLLAGALLGDLPAQEGKGDFSSKATTLKTDDLLKVPEGVEVKDFVLAKSAPEVDVCLFGGLADRGKGTLWSSWGDGCLAKNGKYYTSLGDHLGKDANAYVYEYDPVTRALRRVVDVLEVILHMLGLYGHGKIHSGIHEGDDGSLYFSTYWGKPKEVEAAFDKGYPGSLLLRFDPKTGKTENLGAIVPKQGLPASAFDPSRQLLYFHSVYKGDVTVYDVKARKVQFLGGAESSAAHRTFMVARSGKVYFSGQDGLNVYDPDKNTIAGTKITLPASSAPKKVGKAGKKVDSEGGKGATLRAAARPAKDGTLFGMTAAGRLFAFDPKGETVKDLGPNFMGGDYTAVMALSPDEKYLYFAPGAHGSNARYGAPVVQYEIATGKRKVLAFLQQALLERFKLQVGGTYNVQIDPAGERLFFTFNAAPAGARGTFGQPCVVVLHVPKAER